MEINNEIVLLRQFVRQARICIINKLIREAKRLCASNGNEKLLEKNKNKANKLLREVFALKRVKEDEISKFGIIKFKCLQDILQNPQIDDKTRAMAKVVRYKSLSLKIMEFQEKFPDYDKHISGRKTKNSTKKKGVCNSDSQVKRLENDINNSVEKVHGENAKIINDATPAGHVPCQKERNGNRKCEKLLKGTKLNVKSKDDEGNVMGILNIQDVKIDSKNDQSSKIITKVISNEATVKRFTEVLQETEEEQNEIYKTTKNQQSSNETTEFSKNADDFFLHTNEVTLRSNDTFSKEKNITSQCNINHNAFKSNQTKNKKDKLYNGKIYKEKRNNRKGEMNCTNVFYNQNDTSETRKQNRKGTQVERKEKINSTSSAEYENLHPSWVAKKKQQDIMKQGFQGKKIKFDEN
ncbi:hypothetical protein E2986_00543 [Frieseomelitta varia]|uniref:Serum response factor-binding protein 1 n=1 Tax=Frieseomelitta varia TaxID=561572 RepID=A0A833VQV1_9HYME|nr:uncharacterized protein MAL13P1.304-like [Frieseomelitta varia]KAF3422800.1 hypothetical protein E2986_00543 [Frieseomelitta varia]